MFFDRTGFVDRLVGYPLSIFCFFCTCKQLVKCNHSRKKMKLNLRFIHTAGVLFSTGAYYYVTHNHNS